MKTSTIAIICSFGVPLIAIIGFFIYFKVGSCNKFGSIAIGEGENRIKIDLSRQCEMSYDDLFGQFLGDPTKKLHVLAILKEYGIFSKDDPDLIDEYRNIDTRSPVAIEMQKLLENMEGPFIRSEHSYYDINDSVSLIEGLKSLSPQDPSSRMIRNFCFLNSSFCHDEGIEVRVTVAKPKSVPQGNAAVCRDWTGYFGHHLSLHSKHTNNLKRFHAYNFFRCKEPQTGRLQQNDALPLVQISPEDARDLFGEAIFHKGFMTATLDRAPIGNEIGIVKPESRTADESNEIKYMKVAQD